MTVRIDTLQQIDTPSWDAYAHSHLKGNLYHLAGWKKVIEQTYGHKTYYFLARKEKPRSETDICQQNNSTNRCDPIVGILPVVHLKHFLFGNTLTSIPFFDLGGILADNVETEKALISELIKLAQELNAKSIELRHTHPLSILKDGVNAQVQSLPAVYTNHDISSTNWFIQTRFHKVRMLLNLPGSSDILWRSFKSKLRSQIKKSMKEGLKSKIGGAELLDDFYEVFLINMRDLGSPVHSKNIMKNVCQQFSESAKIFIIYKDNQPVSCSLTVSFKDTLENPWASSLRRYSRLNPNMLLYWSMLEYACDHGYNIFDFGRSTPSEGTYRFKEQWGAKPIPLHWHYLSRSSDVIEQDPIEKTHFDKVIRYWMKLPVCVTRICGPIIRKHIGL